MACFCLSLFLSFSRSEYWGIGQVIPRPTGLTPVRYCRQTFNSKTPGNRTSMPRTDKPRFLQPGMLARGHGKRLNELYTSKCKYLDSVQRVNNPRGHSGISIGINKSDRSFVPHSSIGTNCSARDPFNPMMNAHQLYAYSTASDHDDDDTDNEDINGENDVPSTEDKILICTPLDILMFLTVKSRNILMRHIHLKLGKTWTSTLMRLRQFEQRKKGIAMVSLFFTSFV